MGFLLPSMPPMRYYVCLVCRRCGIISLMSLVVCSMHVCCRCSNHFANFTCSMLDARTRKTQNTNKKKVSSLRKPHQAAYLSLRKPHQAGIWKEQNVSVSAHRTSFFFSERVARPPPRLCIFTTSAVDVRHPICLLRG